MPQSFKRQSLISTKLGKEFSLLYKQKFFFQLSFAYRKLRAINLQYITKCRQIPQRTPWIAFRVIFMLKNAFVILLLKFCCCDMILLYYRSTLRNVWLCCLLLMFCQLNFMHILKFLFLIVLH